MYCIQYTDTHDSDFVIRLSSPSGPSLKSHLQFSGDPEAEGDGLVGVDVALSQWAKGALLD